jgi:AAA+ ATPase superfamily predicted ATPase
MELFVDRNEEIADLAEEYKKTGASFVIVYGRRRLGKTTLLQKFIEDKCSLYFLATEETEEGNRNAFKQVAAEWMGNSILKNAAVENWQVVFEAIAAFQPQTKKCVVIDEFQYLGAVNPAFPSVLQKIWDVTLKDANIMLILCGSLISMMYSQTLSYTSPLYGRRTGQFRIRQIPFRYYGQFFPSFDRKRLVEFYALTGGVPRYIEIFQKSSSVFPAVKKHVLSRTGFLYDEPSYLLQKEVSAVGSYFSIIKTIAAGNRKLSDIASKLGVKQTSLTKYLATLISLDIVEREVPVTEEYPEKSRLGLYKIKDNFLLFWFRFVYPNLSYIEGGTPRIAEEKVRRNFIDSHVSFVYEDICRAEIAGGKKLPWKFTCNKTGRWWNKHTEIDILALDSEGCNAVFGECKYRKGKTGVSVLQDLEEKAQQVDWMREARHNHFVLFSIGGFTDGLRALAKKRRDVFLSE